MPANDHDWVNRKYVCLLLKEIDWVVPLHNIFVVFSISLRIFNNDIVTAGRVHVTKSIV